MNLCDICPIPECDIHSELCCQSPEFKLALNIEARKRTAKVRMTEGGIKGYNNGWKRYNTRRAKLAAKGFRKYDGRVLRLTTGG